MLFIAKFSQRGSPKDLTLPELVLARQATYWGAMSLERLTFIVMRLECANISRCQAVQGPCKNSPLCCRDGFCLTSGAAARVASRQMVPVEAHLSTFPINRGRSISGNEARKFVRRFLGAGPCGSSPFGTRIVNPRISEMSARRAMEMKSALR